MRYQWRPSIALAQSLAVAFKANFSLIASFIALRRAWTLLPSPPFKSPWTSSSLTSPTMEVVEYGERVGGSVFPCRTDGILETLLYPMLVGNGCFRFSSRVSGGGAICFVVSKRSAESVFEAFTTAYAQLSSHGKSCSASCNLFQFPTHRRKKGHRGRGRSGGNVKKSNLHYASTSEDHNVFLTRARKEWHADARANPNGGHSKSESCERPYPDAGG